MDDEILKEFPPFGEIEDLTAETIFYKNVFEYIFSFEDICEREKIILKLEEKAKKFGVKPRFTKILKEYEKKYNKEQKRQERQNNFSKPKHDEIARKIIENENIVRYGNDIYIYENGVYKNDKEAIERKVIELVSDATSKFRTEVYKYLQLTPDVKEVKLNRENGIINFKNGLYSINKKKFIEHTPKVFTINQINTDLNFNALKVEKIDEVLEKLSCGNSERRQTILEIIGYSMTTSVKRQKAFILYGKTARNGKSTLLNMINELIGRNNVSCVSFKDLNTNRFASAKIKNKLLNSGTEMPDDYIEDVSKVKSWITGDYITIEEKGKQMEELVPYAKFIFNANELPRTGDKTGGFYRRLQIIPFEYSFTDKDASEFNFNELVSKEALEYLTKISLEAYENMGESFSNIEESNEEIEKYKIENDSILEFIYDKEYIISFVNVGTNTRYADEVYECYKKHCSDNRRNPIGKIKFYREFEKSDLIIIGVNNHKKTYTFDKNFYNFS